MQFGESEKILKALFTLAVKVQPCIIFLDEIDCLLSERRNDSPESYSTLKSFFLSMWDGFSKHSSAKAKGKSSCTGAAKVVVMGATNRPAAIDKAFLRRFDLKIAVPLPEEGQRRDILQLYVDAVGSDIFIGQKERLLDVLADVTEGYSGSALRNLVKFTIQQKIINEAPKREGSAASQPLSLDLEDFWAQIEKYSVWNT